MRDLVGRECDQRARVRLVGTWAVPGARCSAAHCRETGCWHCLVVTSLAHHRHQIAGTRRTARAQARIIQPLNTQV